MRVLITGATGSLGRALTARWIAAGHEVCGYARCEVRRAEYLADFPDARGFIGDVRDTRRLHDACYGCDVVIMAAALKRVDAGYQHTYESVLTNIIGVQNTIDAAIRNRVKQVILVSSDKAVMAENSYGSTKHVAEFLTIAANEVGYPQGTKLSCVRYGNVFGSRGSVVGIWAKRHEQGRRLCLTDARMTRFWLRLSDAVDLIEWTLDHMLGGEIVLPKLKAMRLVDLATWIAGIPPIIEGKLRPGGEKVHERLLSVQETERTLDRGSHLVIPPETHPWTEVAALPGQLLDSGFAYSSEVAPYGWLTEAEVKAWLKEFSLA